MTDTREAVDAARKAAVEHVRWADAEYNPEYIVLDAIDAFLSKLSESHAIVPIDMPLEWLNNALSGPVSTIHIMHQMGWISDTEARTRREDAERELRRMYAAMIQAASAGDRPPEQHQRPDSGNS